MCAAPTVGVSASDAGLHRQPDVAGALRRVLSRRPAGLITDFDGTLAPIVARPADACILPDARAALAALVQRLALVAVVSGRPAAEVRALVGLDGVVYVGNHGLERWRDGRVEIRPEAGDGALVAKVAADLRRRLAGQPGIWLETKGSTLAIHYRQAPVPAIARAAVLRHARAHGAALEIAEGKKVVELRPRGWGGKPAAVRELVDAYRLRGVVYAGDDRSDLDVFNQVRDLRSRSRAVALVAVEGAEAPPALAAAADLVVNGPEAFAAVLVAVAGTGG